MSKKVKPASTELAQSKYAAMTIDGEHYKLAWDFNHICRAEQEAGNHVNLLAATFRLSRITSAELRAMLFGFLLQFQPKITFAEVGALIRLDTMAVILKTLGVAIDLSVPGSTEEPPADAGEAVA